MRSDAEAPLPVAGGRRLEPLTIDHASAMFEVLSDRSIYRYVDDVAPSSLAQLIERYARLERRVSPDGRQRWLNWVVRLPSGRLAGFVQATLVSDTVAWIAYVLSSEHRGHGHARAATAVMIEHLRDRHGVRRLLARVDSANRPSIALLRALRFAEATATERQSYDLAAGERLFVRGLDSPERRPAPTAIR